MNWKCDNCNSFFTLQYSNNQPIIEIVCPFCKDVSTWHVSRYPNPPEKDVEEILKGKK